jgi:predicted flap endonuclease-1-like 5' DNA nuclease
VRLLRELSGLQANFELKLQAERDKIERAQRDAMQALEHRILEFERRVLVMRELEARVDELEGQGLEAASLSLRNAELEARLAELEAAEAPHRTASEGARPRRAAPNAGRRKAAGGSPASAQDLRRIPGVGPAFARALVAQGITTFEQVAAWTDADIERIAPLIKVKPARIQKEDWVGAARALCASPEKG